MAGVYDDDSTTDSTDIVVKFSVEPPKKFAPGIIPHDLAIEVTFSNREKLPTYMVWDIHHYMRPESNYGNLAEQVSSKKDVVGQFRYSFLSDLQQKTPLKNVTENILVGRMKLHKFPVGRFSILSILHLRKLEGELDRLYDTPLVRRVRMNSEWFDVEAGFDNSQIILSDAQKALLEKARLEEKVNEQSSIDDN